jgi:hypothetical protein
MNVGKSSRLPRNEAHTRPESTNHFLLLKKDSYAEAAAETGYYAQRSQALIISVGSDGKPISRIVLQFMPSGKSKIFAMWQLADLLVDIEERDANKDTSQLGVHITQGYDDTVEMLIGHCTHNPPLEDAVHACSTGHFVKCSQILANSYKCVSCRDDLRWANHGIAEYMFSSNRQAVSLPTPSKLHTLKARTNT